MAFNTSGRRLLRSVVQKLGLEMPAWQEHNGENRTIEEVNIDKLDYADVVLTRAQRISKQAASISGARGRNVDPDLESDVEDTPALNKDYTGDRLSYGEARAPKKLCEEFFLGARYPPFDESDESPPSDYLRMKAPAPCTDQGHLKHQGFGSLKPDDVFWRQRLHERGKKLNPGDWSNEPCDLTPVELAEQFIERDNADARRRDSAKRVPEDDGSDGGASALDSNTHRHKRRRLMPRAEGAPHLSNRQRQRLDRDLEQKARRKVHNQRNRARNQAKNMREAPQEVIFAKHIVAPGPALKPIASTPSSPPSSPTFLPRLSPSSSLQESSPPADAPSPPADTSSPPADTSSPPADTSSPPTRASSPPTRASSPPTRTSSPPPSSRASSPPADSALSPPAEASSPHERSNAPSPVPSSSGWNSILDEEESDDKGEEDFAEIGLDQAKDDEQVDWEAIEALGLDAASVYGGGMPNPDSLPTPASAQNNSPRAEFKLRTTSTGWTGGRAASSEVVALLWAWTHWALGPILRLFTKVQFREGNSTTWTVIKDRWGRNIAVRSHLMHFISGFTTDEDGEELTKNPARPSPFMQQTINEVIEFVRITSKIESGFNVRGFHWFHISGWDRQIKGIPDLRAWCKLNTGPLKWLFREESPWRRLNGVATLMVQAFFPGVFRRYMRCIDYMARKHGIAPFYGVFWQFCINWSESRLLVDCWPHVDAANLAIGVCVIYIFGHFNSNEVCWLVIWEANIIIELPAGIFLAYPSSLFYHFNVNKQDVRADVKPTPYVPRLVVGRKGQKPTPSNTVPLTKRNAEPDAWEKGNVRGSAVWFCQGSMYQPSELGVPTMRAARAQGMNVNVDLDDLMERGELF
ncbi:hypothetical protein CYLTODRAFT_444578 [Cylindrobasidium torrendii FP15055 ss-10]|uniref:Uncharacterized protein n=1 Tax=Cylindrobasidium torrendii FP15055 ss-10 TaxID=1314674 RepID=A0A0D7B8Q1_9AGAR|nr:hypothetical protein CYLTODRAFT_444578 [Cylindrobasidium torrendii FP15055 ss-10]